MSTPVPPNPADEPTPGAALPAPGPRPVRLAVAQLHYHPDFREVLFEPFFDEKRELSSLLPEGKQSAPTKVRSQFKALRQRIRAAYVEQIWRRAEAIVAACRAWEVRLLVFPEYAIPPELLEPIARAAGDMVVVAGTHHVDSVSLDEDRYARLGYTEDVDVGEAVSPVLYQGKILRLVKKMNPAKPEIGHLKASAEWGPVELPSSIPGPLGVLICLDYFTREGEPFRALVAEALPQCRLLAAPLLTNVHSLPELVARARADARRTEMHPPVLLANIASAGGSTLMVDEGRAVDLAVFPEHAGQLEAGEEGVIIADVDLGLRAVGSSTPYVQHPVIIPFAAASLVYAGVDRAFAAWASGFQAALSAPAARVHDKLKAVRSFLADSPPPEAEVKEGTAQGRRLGRLLDEVDSARDLSRIEKLGRELLLPEDVLPLGVLEAALARGSAEEVKRWVDEGVEAFGSVIEDLRKGAEEREHGSERWSPAAQSAVEEVRAQVRGGPKPLELKAVIKFADVLEEEVEKGFEAAKKNAAALFEEGQYAKAREVYREMFDRAQKLVAKAGDLERPRLRKWAALCQLNVSACTLNLQEVEEARALLEEIEAEALSPKGRLNLAEGWGLVGEAERAEAVLPEASALEDEAQRRRLVEIRQRIAVRRGEIPEELVPSAPLRIDAMTLLLARNDLARAGQLALEVLREIRANSLTAALATVGLTDALRKTASENPPNAAMVPLGLRQSVVDVLEKSFEVLRGAALSDFVRKDLDRSEEMFRGATDDEDRIEERKGPAVSDEHGEASASYQAAFRMARDARVDAPGDRRAHVEEALQALPTSRHPWHLRLSRVELLSAAHETDRAIEEALSLAKEFPGRAPIEHITARLCLLQGRKEEALPHAELAFAQLPGKGQRLQLAWLRLESGQAESAWELVERYDEDRPRTLRVRGRVAEQTGRLEEARRAWERYVARRPEDVVSRVRYAQLLFRMHRPEEAAAVAWKTFVEQQSRLDPDALYICGSLQRLTGDLDTEQTRRIKEVGAAIKERYPVDPRADYLRFHLLTMLGELPDGQAPFDFTGMEKAGFVQARPFDDLAERLKQRSTFLDAVAQLARRGAIPTTTASELSNMPLARVITRLLTYKRDAAGLLCPPVSLDEQLLPITLEGATILLSNLELLLLEVLDLSAVLRETLGPTGRLVIFRHVQERILADFTWLRVASNPQKLAETEALLRAIERLPVLEADPRVPYDDVAAARRANAAIVHGEPVEGVRCISPKAFLAYLEQRGCLDENQRARIEPYFADEPEAGLTPVEPIQERLVLEWLFIEQLFKEDVLEAVFEALGGVMCRGPGVAHFFRRQRDGLVERREAERLGERVHQRLMEGWIQAIEEPEVPALPPLREPDQPLNHKMIVEPMREMLAYRQAVLEHPTWWRVTAEFFGSNAVGDPYLAAKLVWSDEEAYRAIADRITKAATRDLTLPMLVRRLISEQIKLDPCLYKLAELGFADALGADEILRLERRYRGLEKAEPRRLLDRLEWMAVEPGHLGGLLARKRLEASYADVIFRIFCKPEHKLPAAEAEAVAYALLARQENIAAKSLGNSLDAMLSFIAYRTLGDVLTGFRQEGEMFVPDKEGSAAALWRAIAGWTGAEGPRRAAYGRALRALWLEVDRREQGQSAVVSAVILELADRLHESQGPYVSLLEPEIEAEAILSARWSERPLTQRGIALKGPRSDVPTQLTYEELLRRGVEILQGEPEPATDGRMFAYALPVEGHTAQAVVHAPVEAILLRAPAVARARLAAYLKGHQGIHDGELYALLERIEVAPEDEEALRAYAHRSAASLFRQVRDDPPFLRVWAQTWMFDKQDDLNGIETLCRILSEPYASPAESLHKELQARVKGAWANRSDAGMLLRVASTVPGSLPATFVLSMEAAPNRDALIAAALQTLDAPDEQPIARVAGDVMFLRVAAARRPLVKFPEGEVDLREILPGRLERLLEKVMAPPTPDTLGAAEAALLRVCGEVVQRLAAPNVLDLRAGLWLTYRLFQWLCVQLAAISPDARRAGIQHLAAQAMPPDVPKDVLDPFGFGRDLFDHRLATLLYALTTMEELVFVFSQKTPPGEKLPEPRSASSPGIEENLLTLARRAHLGPKVGSVLGWDAPGNVPDLALSALLWLNQQRFADLGPEARMRRFEALPLDPEALRVSDEAALMFAHRVVLAAVNTAASLTAEERTSLEAKVRAMANGPTSQEWRWFVFVSLFAAGVDHLEDEARRATLQHLQHPLAPTALGDLVLGAAARDPARVEPLIEEAIAASSEQGVDLIGLVLGALGRLIVNGAPEGQRIAEDLLLRLAKREDFQKDGRMGEMIGLFGLREREA